MKILVTGGAGYIGAHTVRELVNRGYEVVVLDNMEYGYEKALLGQAKLVLGNIADSALLDSLFQAEKPDGVMHFAAYKNVGESVANPSKYFNNNVTGTLSLLDAMVRNNINHFIFSSSCSVYGTPQNLPASETNNPFNPESPYALSKYMVEQILKWYDHSFGLRSISLRYFNAAGASFDSKIGEDWTMSLNLVPVVLKAALGVTPKVLIFGNDYPTRDGTCVRDYIHVVDLADAHVSALAHLKATNLTTSYNLGTGEGSTVQEVVDLAKRISGVDFVAEVVPRRLGDPVGIWADTSKAEVELNWKAKYGLEEIIRTAWEWHSSHPNGYK
ncbi:UDP-glucose 4-epimerase GalE [Candidatus Chlorohelix sp.]|uniref:UDP-glucose 4-epimerase GalE n=1 Tax=Candidatus Chlorohelix sp. TaxID=3139201 RepID=UPI0030613552